MRISDPLDKRLFSRQRNEIIYPNREGRHCLSAGNGQAGMPVLLTASAGEFRRKATSRGAREKRATEEQRRGKGTVCAGLERWCPARGCRVFECRYLRCDNPLFRKGFCRWAAKTVSVFWPSGGDCCQTCCQLPSPEPRRLRLPRRRRSWHTTKDCRRRAIRDLDPPDDPKARRLRFY